MSSQSTYTKGRSRPTRQAAAQHRYADMKLESNGYYIEDQVRAIIGRHWFYIRPSSWLRHVSFFLPFLSQPIANGGSNEPTVRVDLAKLKVREGFLCPVVARVVASG